MWVVGDKTGQYLKCKIGKTSDNKVSLITNDPCGKQPLQNISLETMYYMNVWEGQAMVPSEP